MTDPTQTVHIELRVGQGFRVNDRRETIRRVMFIVRLDGRYAYVREERPPHRRSRILRSRLEGSAYSLVGEMGTEPEFWPAWFREDAEAPNV
jgi:hypothetical protein